MNGQSKLDDITALVDALLQSTETGLPVVIRASQMDDAATALETALKTVRQSLGAEALEVRTAAAFDEHGSRLVDSTYTSVGQILADHEPPVTEAVDVIVTLESTGMLDQHAMAIVIGELCIDVDIMLDVLQPQKTRKVFLVIEPITPVEEGPDA